jgi:uncharacterized protein (TIGR00251 family)
VRRTGVEVRVRLNPRASRDRVDGLYGDRLKIRLTAAPVAGEANEALIRFLAKAARVPPSRGRIVEGARDRSKTVLLESPTPRQTADRLRQVLLAAAQQRR